MTGRERIFVWIVLMGFTITWISDWVEVMHIVDKSTQYHLQDCLEDCLEDGVYRLSEKNEGLRNTNVSKALDWWAQ